MIYGNYLRDKYNNTAVKLADAEGVPCIMEYSKGKNMRNYEIYGNSVQEGTPAPDTPIEIQSVGDLVTDEASEHYGKYDIPIKVYGKNLLNTYGFSAKEMNSPSARRALTNSYGTTISTTEPTNSITITQVYNSDYPASSYKNGYICIGIHDEVIFKKSYRLSFDIDISENPANAEYISISSNGTSSGGSSTRIPLGGTRVSSGIFNFVQSSSVPARRYIELSCMGMSFTISNIMITEADIEDIEYEPYIPPVTTNIYLDEPLRKVGDYADYIGIKDGAVKKHQDIGVISFDSEDTINLVNFAESGSMFYVGQKGVLSLSSGGYVISTHFLNRAELPSGTEKPYVLTITDSIRFYNCTAVYPTLDDFKAFLTAENTKGTPVKLYYILSTPIEENISLPALKTFKGTTVMSVDTSVLPSNIKTKYVRL